MCAGTWIGGGKTRPRSASFASICIGFSPLLINARGGGSRFQTGSYRSGTGVGARKVGPRTQAFECAFQVRQVTVDLVEDLAQTGIVDASGVDSRAVGLDR